jgi:hypothetical protein
MGRIIDVDDWLYDRAHDLVVLWVRLTRLHSEVLVNGTCAANFLVNMLYLALYRSPSTGVGLVLAVFFYFVPRGMRAVGRMWSLLRVSVVMLNSLGCVLGMAVALVDRAGLGREVIWTLASLTYFLMWYLTMVPPLEPPPGQERRASMPAQA